MITEDYVNFETAKLLKEKGFDLPCHATYDTAVTGGKPKFSEYEVLNYFPYGMKNSDDKYSMVISAPTLQMAMKWLREVHNYDISICLDSYVEPYDNQYYIVIRRRKDKYENISPCEQVYFDTHEEACEAAIRYCLENLI
jgi:hypothetical protein